MTLKKGIKIIDNWIENREEKIKEIESKYVSLGSELKTLFIENEKTVIENLKYIKKEISPNCKHPKNMHDTCKGQKYCMDCNMDL